MGGGNILLHITVAPRLLCTAEASMHELCMRFRCLRRFEGSAPTASPEARSRQVWVKEASPSHPNQATRKRMRRAQTRRMTQRPSLPTRWTSRRLWPSLPTTTQRHRARNTYVPKSSAGSCAVHALRESGGQALANGKANGKQTSPESGRSPISGKPSSSSTTPGSGSKGGWHSDHDLPGSSPVGLFPHERETKTGASASKQAEGDRAKASSTLPTPSRLPSLGSAS
jgi:hypothetical protein